MHAVAGYTDSELQIRIRRIGVNISRCFYKSCIAVDKFKQTSETNLVDLQTIFLFLIDGMEDMAIVTLDSAINMAKEMVETAEQLAMAFYGESERVEETLHQLMEKSDRDVIAPSIQGLKYLSDIMRKISWFWRRLQLKCQEEESQRILKRIETAMTKPEASRSNIWGSLGFKSRAIRCYAYWVALSNICGEYYDRIKVTQGELCDYFEENLTTEESIRTALQLANIISKEIKEAWEAITLQGTQN